MPRVPDESPLSNFPAILPNFKKTKIFQNFADIKFLRNFSATSLSNFTLSNITLSNFTLSNFIQQILLQISPANFSCKLLSKFSESFQKVLKGSQKAVSNFAAIFKNISAILPQFFVRLFLRLFKIAEKLLRNF